MSLRVRITLSLLVMSFAAIAVVGATARSVVLRRFDEFVVDRAAEGFRREILAYYQAYGSWEAARTAEPFFAFLQSMPGAVPGLRDRRGGLPNRDGTQGDRPGDARVRRFALGGEPPPFAVTDADGKAVVPLAGLQVGDEVSRERMESARPIVVDGRTVGLAVPMERPRLTELEERYLSAIEDSWLYALLVAAALAVPLGLVLGNQLTRPLREMTVAMGAMEVGNLRQRVEVASGDEVGQLAESFNRMSVQLADAYEELEESRAQLDTHAQAMAELSRRDSLTGLLNRRAFDERAETLVAQASRYGRDLSMAMLDIDSFKQINDDFSHGVGDRVLARAANVLSGVLRETDVVARYGGEEFVVAFPETGRDPASALAERLRTRFEETDWSDLLPDRTVTVSIGVAEVREGEALPDVLARADERLYAAKSGGRNRTEA